MRKEVDFLVLGSGIAGLSYALKVAPHGKVLIVTKNAANDTATWYAQGGIAAVMYTPDSYEKHIQDTLNAGCYLNDEKIVRMTITESTQRVKELIEWGTHFDTESSGKYALAREGGHSEKRVLHYQDKTGAEIQRALIEKVKQHPNIEMLENHFSIDLITQHQLGKIVRRSHPDIQCFGAYVLNPEKGEIITVLAKTTMIATGGSGNVYQTTTNPKIATGDGIAMLYRAKGVVDNMEFIQFHPTSLYNPNEKPSFLISEALRGAGAELKDIDGKEFMQRYDKRKSLAPRDIVARAIDNEMKLSGHDHVYLDARHIDESEIMHHFPTIYAKCLSIGINITKEMIPVVPAAHYICGGIKTDEHGATTIKNAFASGEVTSTGLHGANRLASNSLLESLVFSHNASLKAVELKNLTEIQHDVPDWNADGTVMNEEMILITQSRKELQAVMSNYVGIVRSDLRLKRALDRLEILYRETEDLYEKSVLTVPLCELRNMINVAYLITKFAFQRKESIGLHYLVNYDKN
ncbi:MAG: L-aspartate oxidase [Bacteroidales bacterium]|nr:L-aspartate oxidase [Bacteroidales bacterium]MDN5349137.1 L-aspartate oxidase [Bacteroidales bacterium]